jgi:hypothetical protein
VLLRVSEQRNILHEIRKRTANWIGHILRRNCLLKQVIKKKIKGQLEVTRRQGRRRKKLLDDLGDRRGYSHLKEEALDRIKIVLLEAVDLSSDRLLMNEHAHDYQTVPPPPCMTKTACHPATCRNTAVQRTAIGRTRTRSS